MRTDEAKSGHLSATPQPIRNLIRDYKSPFLNWPSVPGKWIKSSELWMTTRVRNKRIKRKKMSAIELGKWVDSLLHTVLVLPETNQELDAIQIKIYENVCDICTSNSAILKCHSAYKYWLVDFLFTHKLAKKSALTTTKSNPLVWLALTVGDRVSSTFFGLGSPSTQTYPAHQNPHLEALDSYSAGLCKSSTYLPA